MQAISETSSFEGGPTRVGTPPLAKKELSSGSAEKGEAAAAPVTLSRARRGLLVLVFSMAQSIDIFQVSAMMVATAQITADIDLPLVQASWIITAYSITFAGFLLFSGRVADLYSPQWSFVSGFAGLGIISLVNSFVTEKHAFLILRALAGIAGSLTIPSAINLIVNMYENPAERSAMLALFSLSGAVANAVGLVIAGVLMLASWEWIFRFTAIVCLLGAVAAYLLLPMGKNSMQAPSVTAEAAEAVKSDKKKWKRLDIIGAVIITSASICFILSLTQGSIEGWGSAGFIAPLVISFFLFGAFFLWEARLGDDAMLPSSTWHLPNFLPLALLGLLPYLWWGTSQAQLSLYMQEVQHFSPILASARMLPQGIAALVFGALSNAFPVLLSRPRPTIVVGLLLAITGTILTIFSDGGWAKDYWRFLFPSFVLGSFGTVMVFLAANVGIILSVDPSRAGVAGAVFNVILQLGAVVGLSIQFGITSAVGGGLADWATVQAGYYMVIAFFGIMGIQFLLFFKADKVKAPPTADAPVV